MRKYYFVVLELFFVFLATSGIAIAVNVSGNERVISLVMGCVFAILSLIVHSCEKAVILEKKPEN